MDLFEGDACALVYDEDSAEEPASAALLIPPSEARAEEPAPVPMSRAEVGRVEAAASAGVAELTAVEAVGAAFVVPLPKALVVLGPLGRFFVPEVAAPDVTAALPSGGAFASEFAPRPVEPAEFWAAEEDAPPGMSTETLFACCFL